MVSKQADGIASKAEKPVSVKQSRKKRVEKGFIIVNASFNNTHISFRDAQGQVVAWSSSGKMGFKGSRKSTPYAAQMAAEDLALRIKKEFGTFEVDVIIKGPGPGREAAVRTIYAAGIHVNQISDQTPIPHNGCREPKERRV